MTSRPTVVKSDKVSGCVKTTVFKFIVKILKTIKPFGHNRDEKRFDFTPLKSSPRQTRFSIAFGRVFFFSEICSSDIYFREVAYNVFKVWL